MSWKLLAAVAAAVPVPLRPASVADDDRRRRSPEWPHPPGGWLHPYVALDFGYHRPLAINATSLDPAHDGRPYKWRYKLNGDWNGFLRVGYRITPHLRVEFDGGLRESNINSIHSTLAMDPNGLAQGRPGEPWGAVRRPSSRRPAPRCTATPTPTGPTPTTA